MIKIQQDLLQQLDHDTLLKIQKEQNKLMKELERKRNKEKELRNRLASIDRELEDQIVVGIASALQGLP